VPLGAAGLHVTLRLEPPVSYRGGAGKGVGAVGFVCVALGQGSQPRTAGRVVVPWAGSTHKLGGNTHGWGFLHHLSPNPTLPGGMGLVIPRSGTAKEFSGLRTRQSLSGLASAFCAPTLSRNRPNMPGKVMPSRVKRGARLWIGRIVEQTSAKEARKQKHLMR
jgi:hypothetical protein